MKNVIAMAASLLINLSLIAAFEQSASDALPQGEVIVTDLSADLLPSFAQASSAPLEANQSVSL